MYIYVLSCLEQFAHTISRAIRYNDIAAAIQNERRKCAEAERAKWELQNKHRSTVSQLQKEIKMLRVRGFITLLRFYSFLGY